MGDHKEHGINIDPAFVRALAELLDDTQLSEIEVEDGELAPHLGVGLEGLLLGDLLRLDRLIEDL